jgi:hypothetical protein
MGQPYHFSSFDHMSSQQLEILENGKCISSSKLKGPSLSKVLHAALVITDL